jgi:hypothetical protein
MNAVAIRRGRGPPHVTHVVCSLREREPKVDEELLGALEIGALEDQIGELRCSRRRARVPSGLGRLQCVHVQEYVILNNNVKMTKAIRLTKSYKTI